MSFFHGGGSAPAELLDARSVAEEISKLQETSWTAADTLLLSHPYPSPAPTPAHGLAPNFGITPPLFPPHCLLPQC